jgi:hypothetical protein
MAYTESSEGTRKYDNLFEMLADMRQHHEQTKEPLRLDDDPFQRCVGYAADTRAWRIGLTKLRDAMQQNPDRAETVRQVMASVEGRQSLAASIMQGQSVL